MMASQTILCIDPGTNHLGVGVVVKDLSNGWLRCIHSKRYDYTKTKYPQVLPSIEHDIKDVLTLWSPTLVLIENQSSRMRNAHTADVLVGVLAVILCQVVKRSTVVRFAMGKDVTYDLIYPMTTKKLLTGDGKADKATVRRAVEEYFDIVISEDEADALAMAIIYDKFAEEQEAKRIERKRKQAEKRRGAGTSNGRSGKRRGRNTEAQ